MLWTDLQNKTVGIWGMGHEGIAAKRAMEHFAPSAHLIEIEEENVGDLSKCAVVIKSPGVSLYRPEIRAAKTAGVIFTSGTNLFFANKKHGQKVIAITGTKGKSTTSSLLAHTLQTLGKKVALGGNIGVPLLDLIDTDAEIVVAELSSYQCADFVGKPDMAVLVNLYPEHLHWHGSHEQYYADKINMVAQAKTPVLNALDARTKKLVHLPHALYFNREINEDGVFFYDTQLPLFKTYHLPLKGDHNLKNACAVLTVLKALKLDLMAAKQGFKTFMALPHRLEILGDKKELTFVDDSISTTPETAIAALKAFADRSSISLIVGGQDRGQDFTELLDFIAVEQGRIKLITLPDTGIRIAEQAQKTGITPHPANTVEQAVRIAKDITYPGGVVLLSPAAASYNAYKNFEERGADFKQWAFLLN